LIYGSDGPSLAVRQLTLPIGFAVRIEELCGTPVHLGPQGPIQV
jgi:hypothetical protein